MLSAGEVSGDSVRGGSVGSVETAGTSFCSVVGPAADCSRLYSVLLQVTLFCRLMPFTYCSPCYYLALFVCLRAREVWSRGQEEAQ